MRLLLLIFIIQSCTTTKDFISQKSNIKRDVKSKEIITNKRDADTLTINVPIYKFKDTTIIRRGKSQTIYMNYDKNGSQNVKSICDGVDELHYREHFLNEKLNSETEKKHKKTQFIFKDIYILYLFMGLGFLIVVKKYF